MVHIVRADIAGGFLEGGNEWGESVTMQGGNSKSRFQLSHPRCAFPPPFFPMGITQNPVSLLFR